MKETEKKTVKGNKNKIEKKAVVKSSGSKKSSNDTKTESVHITEKKGSVKTAEKLKLMGVAAPLQVVGRSTILHAARPKGVPIEYTLFGLTSR